jgi:hypothetical protein
MKRAQSIHIPNDSLNFESGDRFALPYFQYSDPQNTQPRECLPEHFCSPQEKSDHPIQNRNEASENKSGKRERKEREKPIFQKKSSCMRLIILAP